MQNPNKLFPLIVTKDLKATKKFYTEQAEFEITIEADGYLQVRSALDVAAPEICFMTPEAMSGGPAFPPFDGKGLILSVPTQNSDKKAAALRKAGLTEVPEPSDKPWGWRSFVVSDPNGVLLDFFHVVEKPAGQA